MTGEAVTVKARLLANPWLGFPFRAKDKVLAYRLRGF